jgi:hypothetical protein
MVSVFVLMVVVSSIVGILRPIPIPDPIPAPPLPPVNLPLVTAVSPAAPPSSTRAVWTIILGAIVFLAVIYWIIWLCCHQRPRRRKLRILNSNQAPNNAEEQVAIQVVDPPHPEILAVDSKDQDDSIPVIVDAPAISSEDSEQRDVREIPDGKPIAMEKESFNATVEDVSDLKIHDVVSDSKMEQEVSPPDDAKSFRAEESNEPQVTNEEKSSLSEIGIPKEEPVVESQQLTHVVQEQVEDKVAEVDIKKKLRSQKLMSKMMEKRALEKKAKMKAVQLRSIAIPEEELPLEEPLYIGPIPQWAASEAELLAVVRFQQEEKLPDNVVFRGYRILEEDLDELEAWVKDKDEGTMLHDAIGRTHFLENKLLKLRKMARK